MTKERRLTIISLSILAAIAEGQSDVFRLFYRFGFDQGRIGDPKGAPTQNDIEGLMCATNEFLSESMQNYTENDAIQIYTTEINWGLEDWIYNGSEPEAPRNVPVIVNFTAVATTNDGSKVPSNDDIWEATKYFDYFAYIKHFVWNVEGQNIFKDTRGMWYEPFIEPFVKGQMPESSQCPGAPTRATPSPTTTTPRPSAQTTATTAAPSTTKPLSPQETMSPTKGQTAATTAAPITLKPQTPPETTSPTLGQTAVTTAAPSTMKPQTTGPTPGPTPGQTAATATPSTTETASPTLGQTAATGTPSSMKPQPSPTPVQGGGTFVPTLKQQEVITGGLGGVLGGAPRPRPTADAPTPERGTTLAPDMTSTTNATEPDPTPPPVEQPSPEPAGSSNVATIKPTTEDEEMVYFNFKIGFFEGLAREPKADEIEAMICQANKWFEESIRDLVPDPNVESYATNIDWEYKPSDSLPLTVWFTSHTTDAQGKMLPVEDVYEYILKGADAESLIKEFIWQSEPYTTNIFYNTKDILLGGSHNGAKQGRRIVPGKLAKATCPS